MSGNLLVKLLIVQYLLAMCLFLYSGNYPKALYWLGAAIISYSILIM